MALDFERSEGVGRRDQGEGTMGAAGCQPGGYLDLETKAAVGKGTSLDQDD